MHTDQTKPDQTNPNTSSPKNIKINPNPNPNPNPQQESTVHTETLDAVTRYLGLGSYAQWDEETRMSWLNTELTAKRPLLQHVRSVLRFYGLFVYVHVCMCVRPLSQHVRCGMRVASHAAINPQTPITNP